ncbi:MAG: hypothetical protein EOO88_23240 [Pedobacter sp.]|nr:MAG: hypothetical protein EOO88_23240 [Pedobacter sp.]
MLDKNAPYKLISGSKASSDLGIEELDLPESKSARFSAVVDLTALPPYARSIKYLRENLKLTAKGCDAKVEITPRPFIALKNKKQMTYLE